MKKGEERKGRRKRRERERKRERKAILKGNEERTR
jgi:hypothetical protein